MREFISSLLKLPWAMPLFGLKQVAKALLRDPSKQPQAKIASGLHAFAEAAEAQLDGVTTKVVQVGSELQQGMLQSMGGALPGQQPSRPQMSSTVRVDSGRLDTKSFVVLGEGLAAGMGDFTLSAPTQGDSFTAQMARQMQAEFLQPLIEPPGLGNPVGFAELPVQVPAYMQSTVLEGEPRAPFANLSVPGFRVSDALRLRPVEPLVHRTDAKQTGCNLILGMSAFTYGEKRPWPTQLESALARSPTFTLVALGYYELLEAAIALDPRLLPRVDRFSEDYAEILRQLHERSQDVLAMTLPDPLDTAHFSDIETAAKILKVEPAFLSQTYELQPNSLLTVEGLNEIGFQIFGGTIGELPAHTVMSSDTAQRIRQHVDALNASLNKLAADTGTVVYDLHGFLGRVKSQGIVAGSQRLTAEFLGGFYSLNGYYPGATGHALIANEAFELLNSVYGSQFPPIDVDLVRRRDPVAGYRQAEGPNWTADQLSAPRVPQSASQNGAPAPDAAQPAPTDQGARTEPSSDESGPLRLPPGLEQVISLHRESSYFGDAISPLNCRNEADIPYGSGGAFIFGGYAIVDSHLSGSVRIKFSPPVDNTCDFEIHFPEGLTGEDSILAAPRFFRMPFQQNRVDPIPGMVSSGKLDLTTGEAVLAEGGIPMLSFFATFTGNALKTLGSVNPTFPHLPGHLDKAGPIVFPGPPPQKYGSSWVKFEQRQDGLLDFTFFGSTFAPLGNNIRWPLVFSGPTGRVATIPANGSVMHPHLHLSTKAPAPPVAGEDVPEIPPDTIQELTLYSHNTSFGDKFSLHVPEFGGPATGRSHMLGRVQIQTGSRIHNTIPVTITHLNPGGVLEPLPESPISQFFPGRLPHGPRGFDELLRFPLRTYSLDDLIIVDDPFDISVGLVDLRTGRFINEVLHRGFINQDLIFALLRIEPRTPKSSFLFRGPARFSRGAFGESIFRFQGGVLVPYPAGFHFPQPNLTNAFTVARPSKLDPFLWTRGVLDEPPKDQIKRGSADNMVSSTGERFSFKYSISADPARHPPFFEYQNHSQKGCFHMHGLTWCGFSQPVDCGHAHRHYDTVTFTGFGIWRKDGIKSIQQVSVQISTSPETPYVGIQVASADVSDVNTKPENMQDVIP